jgi:hypothetical protein
VCQIQRGRRQIRLLLPKPTTPRMPWRRNSCQHYHAEGDTEAETTAYRSKAETRGLTPASRPVAPEAGGRRSTPRPTGVNAHHRHRDDPRGLCRWLTPAAVVEAVIWVVAR